MEELINKIFEISNEEDFEQMTLRIFSFQYEKNYVYRNWCKLMKKDLSNVKTLFDIPFLPISFFKTHNVVSFEDKPVHFFKSSGTTSKETSKHFIHSLDIYERSFTKCFEEFFSKKEEYCFIVLLPNYIEQGNSSLVYMIDNLIKIAYIKKVVFIIHLLKK